MIHPHLQWKLPDGGFESFAISSREVLIGRKTDSDLVISNQNVSRRHAKVVQGPNGYELIDLESKYGTLVNGKPVERHVLRHGDRISFGRHDVEFRFVVDDTQRRHNDTTRVIQKSLGRLSQVLPSTASDLEKILYVLDFQQQWSQVFTPESGLEQILESAVKISGAERAFIMTRAEGGFKYATGLDGRGRKLWEREFQTSRTVVGDVVEKEKAVFMVEGIDSQFAQQASIMAMNVRALACLPLFGIPLDGDRPEILGILYLDSTKVMHSLSGLDQKILNKLAVEAGNVLERVEMIKSSEQRKTLERDLALAEETQRNLLPHRLPDLGYLKLGAFCRPTRYVGGDFYHFHVTDSGDLIGVLADVSGKGVSASLLSSMLLGCIQLLFSTGRSPADALNELNGFFHEKAQGKFATVFLFTTRSDGTGQFISAGHNPAYLYRASSHEIEELESTSLILGAFDFASYEAFPLTLGSGDILLAYSDGLTDAEDASGEMFGEMRIKQIIQNEAPSGAEKVQSAILRAVEEFTGGRTQTDDITLMIAQLA
jgi:sigma-B regulation protein RsbU (phosphoserine phosphatase)